MKRHIFILSSLLCICGTQYAYASDTLEEEKLVTIEPTTPPEPEYTIGSIDEIVESQTCQDDLIIPSESTQNLWTDDAIISNSKSMQAVVLKPMKHNKEQSAPMDAISGYSLGNQSYYGETVYIINNFLSQESDNVFETEESADTSVFAMSSRYVSNKISAKYSECPFNTAAECAIWMRKPIISEVVAPRSKQLMPVVMAKVSYAIENNPNISANDVSVSPLLNRYKVLKRASRSCCTGGLTYKLQKSGAPQKMIYKFLSDDANFSGFGQRCMVMGDAQIDETEKSDITFENVVDVRNTCICKSKESLKALLAPFEQLYEKHPEFADAPFEYKHYDGVGRKVTESVNMDVQNVLNQLDTCL